MRAADCEPFVGKTRRVFRQFQLLYIVRFIHQVRNVPELTVQRAADAHQHLGGYRLVVLELEVGGLADARLLPQVVSLHIPVDHQLKEPFVAYLSLHNRSLPVFFI